LSQVSVLNQNGWFIVALTAQEAFNIKCIAEAMTNGDANAQTLRNAAWVLLNRWRLRTRHNIHNSRDL
jgi:hypothetical protein